jgi:hypothetical protein
MIERSALLKDLQGELPKIEKDILAYSESREDLTAHLKDEYNKAREAGRTAEHFVAWREAQITQAAVAWVLSCVFLRFLEDNGLLAEPMLAGPVESEQGDKRLDHAKQRMVAYYNENPTHEDREYLFSLFEQLEKYPVIAELLDHKHNPLWQIPVSADGAKRLIDFFQKIDAASGEIVHDFTDSDWDTRFLGDLYQDLSEAVRKRYALLQTPEFVESFILDYTLEKAKETFGLPGLRLIDPTCGSGHFLLTTFERVFEDWQKREPATNTRELAQRALDVVHGVDINPYAIAICRFRLLIAAMKVSGTHKVMDAPDFHFNLACGDSLLHGRRFEWQGQGLQADLIDEDPMKHVFEVEDKEKLLKILGQQYHAVVGNPPYIVVRDKALNQAYRDRYVTCHRKYSLGVPFTERFFELAVKSLGVQPSGYMGMITANSFMKREFGTKLIGNYLCKKNLTHIIDTSGAYIPGHGTPTVILFGRNTQPPRESSVRVVMGIRAEPTTPEKPEDGKVWSSIMRQIEDPGSEGDYISVDDKDRSIYATHPWSLTGGGALELKALLEKSSKHRLAEFVDSIGFGAILGEDEAFGVPSSKVSATQIPSPNKQLIEGELIRDWCVAPEKTFVFPYDENVELIYDDKIIKWLWPLKTLLWMRAAFNRETYRAAGKSFYEYHQIPKERNKFGNVITFPEIASHNHFMVAQTDKIFSQTAPIIKLTSEADTSDYQSMAMLLNSSAICFYMKQICHQKQLTGGDGVRVEFVSKVPYQFSGTALKKIPVPYDFLSGKYRGVIESCSNYAKELSDVLMKMTAERALFDAMSNDESIHECWDRVKAARKEARSKLILIQEEVDWLTYRAFGLCDESCISKFDGWMDVKFEVGQRPFEILTQLNQDGFEVPKEIPLYWPDAMKRLWIQRMNVIRENCAIRVVEDPHYKRRWIGRQGLFNKSAKADEMKSMCKLWLLEYLENHYLKSEELLITSATLADRVRADESFIKVATYYTDDNLFDPQKLVSELVAEENIPQFSAGRYKNKAIVKFRAWQETWAKQSQEDLIDKEFGVDHPLSQVDTEDVDKLLAYELAKKQAENKKAKEIGVIPIPPKYAAGDFRKPSYWPLRGKLDVPKERFFSLPGCEKEGDATLVIGWAGMNHLQRAQAIASWYLDRKERDGWESDKLTPMLVAIDELIPWLKQWHNDIDLEFGERMGDYYEGFLLEELRQLNMSRDELLAWEPPAAPKKQSAAKKKKATAE